jgi:hypothetical protein
LTQEIKSVQATPSIEQIRRQGFDAKDMQKIQDDKAEFDRIESRPKGNFITFKNDKEQKTLLFTGKYEKAQVPDVDFATKQEIPGKFVTKWRFQVWDTTNPSRMPEEPSIWERGWRDAKTIIFFLGQGKAELTVIRNGQPGANTTSYLIFPK